MDFARSETCTTIAECAADRLCAKSDWFIKPALVMLILATLANSGCVRKRLTFRTNPNGAMVYVDKQPIGLTPVSTNYTYYGTRNIEIVRDGYRTEKFLRKIRPPWYEIPPLDFVSETLWPFEMRDERIIDVQMTPDPVIANEALISTGEQLRLQASQGVAVSPPPTAVPMAGPIPVVPSTFGQIPASTHGHHGHNWNPGHWLRGIIAPGGSTPVSTPVMDVTPGGGLRPPF